ncbi:unnamed protein product [Oikopleura dioica]|uniref:RRM domain-containing protein n=1 Tax=Oikopleura dioica TaxID=34765 RepID=E4WYM4_OIKDI|nr:unnamed protein product [Oikopleura dioica]
MFKEFGEVFDLQILRDRITGHSRGCCFVTFFETKSADDAQRALNGIRVLPGMLNPVQMRAADSEKRSDRRLFIGMLPITCDEEMLKKMFEQYGKIQELQVLRKFNGTSRRCAFLTFSSRLEAQSAVQALNNTVVSSICAQGMVVRLADTPKQKEKRKLERQLKSCAMQLQRLCTDEDDLVGKLLLPSLCNLALSSTKLPSSSLPLKSHHALPAVSTHHQPFAQNKPIMNNGWNNNNDNGGSTGNASDDSTKSSTENQTIGGTQAGPEGANLFVYHLPKRFNDSDLYALFSTIGELMSAKVYVDRHTQESKCFGFVSYKHIIDASAAIKRFNTYQVDDKRLKVEMKKPRQRTSFVPPSINTFGNDLPVNPVAPVFVPAISNKSVTPIWGPQVESSFFTNLLQ